MITSKRKILAAVAVTGVVAASGSAFTDANDLPSNDTGSVGYGATTVTGVIVKSVQYIADTTDGAKLASIVVVSEDPDAADSTGTVTLRSSVPAILTTEGCGTAVLDTVPTPDTYTYTCTLTPQVNAADVETVGFTATANSQ